MNKERGRAMKTADVMTTRVISVPGDMPVNEVAKLLLENRISAVPVVDADGRLLGIVSEGDLMRREETGTEAHQSWWLSAFTRSDEAAEEFVKSHGRFARDVMTHAVVTVSEDTPLAEVAQTLERRGIKRVPVVRDGRVVGVVSRANLLQALAAAPAPAAPATAVDDATIRRRFLKTLDQQPWRATTHANVIVSDGVVHLWGLVPSEEQRDALRVLAENIEGVRAIEDNLRVQPNVAYYT
jgi:CBS domain-containing protein